MTTTVTSPPSAAHLAGLLFRVQHQDHEAFQDLHDLTSRLVYQIVNRTLRVPDLADEVVQDIYLYVWQNAGYFDASRGSAFAWLAVLAHRRAVDRVRSVARTAARDDRAANDYHPPWDDTADLGLARAEASRIRSALTRLTASQREAVSLTFLNGYTHAQAARHLGVPVGTLKSRVRDGLINLRQHVGVNPHALDHLALPVPSRW